MKTLLWLAVTVLVVAPVAASPAPGSTGPTAGIDNPWTSTPVDLWMHCTDAHMDCPVNTQEPQGRYLQPASMALVGHSQGCVDNPTGAVGSGVLHTRYGYSSPGYVEYDIDEGGKPRYHPERGIAYDVVLDGETTPWVEAHVQVKAADGAASQVPLVAPGIQVVATVREGDDVSMDQRAFNEGAVIAQGSSDPADLHPLMDHPQVEHADVGGQHVYTIRFPLTIEKTTIRAEEAFNIRFDVRMENPVCNDGDDYVTPQTVAFYDGADHWWRLQWSIMNPVRIESLVPQIIGDDVIIHASAISPWGNYDLAGDRSDEDDTFRLRIEGPEQPDELKRQLVVRAHEYDHHNEAAKATWIWNHGAHATDGTYQVRFEVENDQRTAMAIATAWFALDGDDASTVACHMQDDRPVCLDTKDAAPAQTTPMPAGLVIAALLGLLTTGRRARDNP